MGYDNGTGSGNQVAVSMQVTLSLAPKEVPHPRAGSSVMSAAVEQLMRARGLTCRVEGITMIVLSKPNDNPAELFAETKFKVLDGNGEPLPDRQLRAIEHEGLSHPFELLMAEGQAGREHSYGYFATSYDAMALGGLWQKGLLDVRMRDLPVFVGESTPRTERAV